MVDASLLLMNIFQLKSEDLFMVWYLTQAAQSLLLRCSPGVSYEYFLRYFCRTSPVFVPCENPWSFRVVDIKIPSPLLLILYGSYGIQCPVHVRILAERHQTNK